MACRTSLTGMLGRAARVSADGRAIGGHAVTRATNGLFGRVLGRVGVGRRLWQ
jgi:hypothetical protein